MNAIARTGGNKKPIDLKVVKAHPKPPLPPSHETYKRQVKKFPQSKSPDLDTLNAPVLRPGPPYNDHVLIQNYVNKELEAEKLWQGPEINR